MVAAGYGCEDAKLFSTVEAVGMELCPQLGICIPVGKDSMSMRTVWKDGGEERSNTAPLSLIVSAFAPVTDIRKTSTPQIRSDKGDTTLVLIDLGHRQHRLGGSALAQVFRNLNGAVPDLDNPEDLKNLFAFVQVCRNQNFLLAYHDRSDGGLFTTVAEMCFAAHCGVDLQLKDLADEDSVLASLFTEELGVVLQVNDENLQEISQLVVQHNLQACFYVIGKLNHRDEINISFGEDLSLIHI